MMYIFVRSLILGSVLAFISMPVFARGGHHASGRAYSSHTRARSSVRTRSKSYTVTVYSKSRAIPGVKRDGHGRIERSSAAKHQFMKETGYPHGRPGYVVDHVVPLKCGGADKPSNMKWQTKAEAKAKDRRE